MSVPMARGRGQRQVLGGGLLAVGLVLLTIAVATPNVLATLIVDTTPPSFISTFPYGTQTTPTPLQASFILPFNVVVTDNNDMFSVAGVTATCTSGAERLCVKYAVWSGSSAISQPNLAFSINFFGSVASPQFCSAGYTCTIPTGQPSKTTCAGGITCFAYPTNVGPFPSGLYIRINPRAWDAAGNLYSQEFFGITGTPSGYFLVNGVKKTTSDTIVVSNPTITFQLNMTNLPNQLTDATISWTLTSPTGTPSDSRCYVGTSAGCVAPPQTTTASFYLYPITSLAFADGTYTIIGTINYSGGSLQVLSLIVDTHLLPPVPGLTDLQTAQVIIGGLGAGLIIAGFSVATRRQPMPRFKAF